MALKNITDNVQYRLGEKNLLILVYDDNGKELACELFEIGYKGLTSYLKKADMPEPYPCEIGKFTWVCDKCGDKCNRPGTSCSDLPCEKCKDGTYKLGP